MKSVAKFSQLCAAFVLVGCTTVGHEKVYNDASERRGSNVEMINNIEQEMMETAIVRQGTIYSYQFMNDTPILNDLGERDLVVLATHYKENVLPHLTQRKILQEVTVHFDYDESDIRSDAVPSLDEAIALLEANPDADLLITGHADARGSVEYNDRLGARRAESVRQYLSSKGMSSNRVRILSRGERDAGAMETDEQGMQADRYAQFMVAEMQEFPIGLNVKQGGVSDELYAARKKAVRNFLDDQGVNVDAISMVDGVAGGDGMSSKRVVIMVTEGYTSAPKASSSGGGESASASSDSGGEN